MSLRLVVWNGHADAVQLLLGFPGVAVNQANIYRWIVSHSVIADYD